MTPAQLSTHTFELFVAATAFGCVIAAVLVSERTRDLLFAAIAIGAFAGLFYGGSVLGEDQLWMLAGLMFASAVLALCAAFALRLGHRYRLLENVAALGDDIHSALCPRLWAAAAGKPQLGARDLAKRIFVAVAAATGSVAGALMALDISVLGNALRETLTPHGVLATVILAVISFTLIGPLHEFVLGRAASRGGQNGKEDESLEVVFAGFLEQAPLRSMTRFALILLVMLLIELIYHSLDDTVRSGAITASLQVLLAAMTPAVVSYYWSAALQLGAPSIRASATVPSVAMGAALNYGLALAGVFACYIWAILLPWMVQTSFSHPDRQQAANVVALFAGPVLAPFFAIWVAIALSWLVCGIYALAGGYALDRSRGQLPMVAVLIGLLLAAAAHQAVVDALIWLVGGKFDSWIDGTYLFFATLGWYVGLWASGFPWLLQKPEHAMA